MSAQELKLARKERRWTQAEAAERLGVSQPYLALLENGKRALGPKLARRAVAVRMLCPTALPLRQNLPAKMHPQKLAQQLAALGYPGFGYLRPARKRNPAEVLLTALAQENLESRLTEALPWLLLHYSDMNEDWLVQQARVRNLSNRVGFVVSLAKGVAARAHDSARYEKLNHLEAKLQESRLDKEDTLCQSSLTLGEREWLRETRPAEAAYWHLLTDWRPEHLQYA